MGDFEMKRITTLLGAVSAVALVAGAAQAGEITGRVTEATGSVGLQGAIVRISETGQTVSTSRDGSFRLGNVPAGDFTLVVDYLGADAQTREVTLTSADAMVETNFVLGADVAVEALPNNVGVLRISYRIGPEAGCACQRAAQTAIT